MNPWKVEFLMFILLLGSCGDNQENTVVLQDQIKDEQKKRPPPEPKADQSRPATICSRAHNKEELLILFEDDKLPKETTENYYYIEERCESISSIFGIFKKTSCSSTTNPVPRHARETIQHEMASSKKELTDLFLDRIEKSKPYEKVDSYGYEHRIYDYLTGNVWQFNLCFPLTAQPTKIIYK